MDQVKLDAATSFVVGNYKLMLDGMLGSLARAIDSNDPTTPIARTKLKIDISAIQSHFGSLLTDVGAMHSYTALFMGSAIDEAGGLSDADKLIVSSHVNESLDEVCSVLRACAARDAYAVERELRKLAVQVELLQAASGITKVGALIRLRNGRLRNLKLVQNDRLGRKVKSDEFVRLVVRWHFISTYAESFVFTLAKNGSDLARIVSDDREDFVFSITGQTDGYPTYQEALELLHPNTRASIGAL